MSIAFRELLKTIGSGPHTGENLSRDETAAATRMMLTQEATPAQIGAFMIAHRIKRPTGEERPTPPPFFAIPTMADRAPYPWGY
jgi:anthranilate phosphoribosyltransferase